MVGLWGVSVRSVGIYLFLMQGTAQPEWLDRFRKVRTPNHRRDGLHASRGADSKLVADVPGFEPGFSA